jgi:hypothetical protein
MDYFFEDFRHTFPRIGRKKLYQVTKEENYFKGVSDRVTDTVSQSWRFSIVYNFAAAQIFHAV